MLIRLDLVLVVHCRELKPQMNKHDVRVSVGGRKNQPEKETFDLVMIGWSAGNCRATFEFKFNSR
jgi:hypothetical protein